VAGLKTGHYKNRRRPPHVAKGAAGEKVRDRRDALMCCCYWTIRVNLVVAVVLPVVAVTVTV
jgi:hypothetical protein